MKFSSERKIYFLFHSETKKGNLYIKYSDYFNVWLRYFQLSSFFRVNTLVPFYLKFEESKDSFIIYSIFIKSI